MYLFHPSWNPTSPEKAQDEESKNTSMSTFLNTIHHLHLHLLVQKEMQGLMDLRGTMSSNSLEGFGIGMVPCCLSLMPHLSMYKSLSWGVMLLM